MYEYSAVVLRHVDGDTYKMEVDLGFEVLRKITLRLVGTKGGVDTPEIHGKTVVEGLAALRRVRELMPVGSTVTVATSVYKVDGFNRYLAQITLPDGRDLGDTLLAEGHAKVWTG